MIRNSNTKFLTVDLATARDRLGWWLEVYDHLDPNQRLARVYRFKSLSFSEGISELGVGQATLYLDDPVWEQLPPGYSTTYLFEHPNIWRVYEDAVERFRFLHESHKYMVASATNDQAVELTGPGWGDYLRHATVLPPDWPSTTVVQQWEFTGQTWAHCYRMLFEAAQARGTIPPQFILSFTDTTDSLGVPWTDVGDYQIAPGGDLLKTLGDFAEKIGFQWTISSKGVIGAALRLGIDKSGTVRFFEGISVREAEQTEDRKDLYTDVYVADANQGITHATSETHAAKYSHREVWVSQSEIGDAATRAIVADTILRLSREPDRVRTFKVRNDAPGARAFKDYRTGDLVGYGPRIPDGSADFQVTAMGVKVENGQVDFELALLGKPQLLEERLERALKGALGGNYSTSSSGGGVNGTVNAAVQLALTQITFDDLVDVQISSPAEDDQVRWDDGLKAWVNFTPTAPTTNLDALSDVTLTSPTDLQQLRYDSATSQWVNFTPSTPVVSLDGLSDVTLTGVANDQQLRYSAASGQWVNFTPSPKITVSTTAPSSPATNDLWAQI